MSPHATLHKKPPTTLESFHLQLDHEFRELVAEGRDQRASPLWERHGGQTLSLVPHVPLRGGEPQSWFHKFRQLFVVDAHNVPAHHFRLLGERVQYGKVDTRI